MEAFSKRTPCFLDEPEWRELCWEIHSSVDLPSALVDSTEEYFQATVRLPGYTSEVFDALSTPEASQSYLESLIQRGQSHYLEFQEVHTKMANELLAIGKEPSETKSPSSDKMFPRVWTFPDIHVASLYCGYWSALILLNITVIGLQAKVARLYRSFDPAHFGDLAHVVILPNGGSQLVPQRTARRPLWDAARTVGDHHAAYQDNRGYAREICKCVEYIQHTPFIGPMFLIMGLRMAMRMDLSEGEKSWIIGKLNAIGKNTELARTKVETWMSEKETHRVEEVPGERWRLPAPPVAGTGTVEDGNVVAVMGQMALTGPPGGELSLLRRHCSQKT